MWAGISRAAMPLKRVSAADIVGTSVGAILRWNVVDPTRVPRVTTKESSQRQPCPLDGAKPLQCGQRIRRTGRVKPARRRKQRGDEAPIPLDQDDQRPGKDPPHNSTSGVIHQLFALHQPFAPSPLARTLVALWRVRARFLAAESCVTRASVTRPLVDERYGTRLSPREPLARREPDASRFRRCRRRALASMASSSVATVADG